MNAHLRTIRDATAAELGAQLVEAVDALPGAASRADLLTRDKDRMALDLLERLAERASGIARLSMLTRSALMRDLEPPGPQRAWDFRT